jgi:hypothetical protein
MALIRLTPEHGDAILERDGGDGDLIGFEGFGPGASVASLGGAIWAVSDGSGAGEEFVLGNAASLAGADYIFTRSDGVPRNGRRPERRRSPAKAITGQGWKSDDAPGGGARPARLSRPAACRPLGQEKSGPTKRPNSPPRRTPPWVATRQTQSGGPSATGRWLSDASASARSPGP